MINKKNKEYWKCQSCKIGDMVEVAEDLEYAAKTIYKVAYYYTSNMLFNDRILVEVDSRKNYFDRKWIKGWLAQEHLSSCDIKKYQIDPKKHYWWIYWWNLKASNFLENE